MSRTAVVRVFDFVDAIFPPSCGGCGAVGSGFCKRCEPPPESNASLAIGPLQVRTVGDYEGALKHAVLAQKRGRRDVAVALGRLLGRHCIAPGCAVTLVWAPTSAARRRARGFDQAEIIARAAAAERGLAVKGALKRMAGPAQAGRTRLERLGTGSRFICEPAALVPGSRVMLVDDVVTTGATLRDAAQAITAAGFQLAGAVVVARAPLAGRTPSHRTHH